MWSSSNGHTTYCSQLRRIPTKRVSGLLLDERVMEFATGALGTLLPKLAQLLQDEYNLHKGAKKNIKFVTSELESIQAALRNVDKVPREELSELVKIWARDARELSYDMEDVVDTFLVRVQGPDKRPSKRSARRFIKNMMGFVTKAKIQHEIGQEIKEIKDRVNELAGRRHRYKVDAIPPAKTSGVDPRIESLYAKAANLFGVNEASEELITMLSTQQRIVSIVGFGGLGKTTLAKEVYDKIKEQFDCTAFVSVGRSPDLKIVFKNILINLDKKQYMNFNFSILEVEQLINELRDFLEKKRYLIVIDDLWETQSWRTIKLALVENNCGSRIIITTRTHEVATEAGGVHEQQPLSDDNSRKLFFTRIFGGEIKPSDHGHLDDEVSDKILRKCGGVPLAIITVASLLIGKHREEWLEVHRSFGFDHSKKNWQVENTMKILSLSYYDLPSHLRACLLHLSVFPEDYFIEKDPLIWMWVAEGFVHEKQGISSLEIGEGYFNELVNRNMIQLVEEWHRYDCMVYSCHIHDMVLDLIRSISSEENFVNILDYNEGTSSPQGKIRRLALQNNYRTSKLQMKDMQHVRSFVSFGCDIDKGLPLSSFELVRVLAMDNSTQFIGRRHLQHLPNLVHLRYLRLTGYFGDLPEDITTLKFLQTLDVEALVVNKVSINVGLLTQLLCLRFRSAIGILPDGIGKLASLEELQIMYDGELDWACRRFLKELGSLRELRVLRMRLGVESSDNKVPMEILESLCNLEKVEYLSLMLTLGLVRADTAALEAAGFLLPRHLKKLFISWIQFSRFPTSCINPSRVPKLSHLYLYVKNIEEQDLIILSGLFELRFLELKAESTTVVVSSTSASTDAVSGAHKLSHCRINSWVVWFKDDSGSVSFRMERVEVSTPLGSEGKDGGKAGVAPNLMRSLQHLEFSVWVREWKDGNGGDRVRLGLEYFPSLRHVIVFIYCNNSSAAEVEEVEAVLSHAADVHSNRPAIHLRRYREEEMVPAAPDQEAP